MNFGRILKTNFGEINWAIFFRKNAPKDKKFRPNGEISPNLVILALKRPRGGALFMSSNEQPLSQCFNPHGMFLQMPKLLLLLTGHGWVGGSAAFQGHRKKIGPHFRQQPG
jgi:hypothetical protein